MNPKIVSVIILIAFALSILLLHTVAFPNELSDLTAHVCRDSKNIEDDVIALKEYIYDTMKPDHSIASPADVYRLPSIERLKQGAGWCDQQVDVFRDMAKYRGLNVRKVFLLNKDKTASPHTIAEVCISDRWVIVDVSNNLDLRNKDGELATRADIREDFGILINNPKVIEMGKGNATLADPKYWKMFQYPCYAE